MFKNYNHLGFFSPYTKKKNNGSLLISSTLEELIDTSNPLNVDISSLIQILSRGFPFHNRTILKEIKKSPWLAKPNSSEDDWKYFDLPKHGNNSPDQDSILLELSKRLKNEIIEYIGNSKNIGILLSGGMDSRITAGLLNQVTKEEFGDCEILAITWGAKDSRDVIYAQEISKIYDWEWLNLEITTETLYENIVTTADMLCEFAPFHLHAMRGVSNINGLDCILASSFGDSIGRGVYSSRHLLDLTPLKIYLRNWYNIIEKETFKFNIDNCYNDLNYYNNAFSREEKWQSYEIERQAIYMRRLLNPCLELINKKIPVYQTFSSPDIYSYIWSINPHLRNDKIYEILIEQKLTELKNIPWSKTGIPFNQSYRDHKPDNFSKDYHRYPDWIRNDLFQDIYKLCMSHEVENLKLFNMDALKKLLVFNSKLKVKRITHIDSFSIWLASFAMLLNKYPNIQANVISQKFGNPVISTTEFLIATFAQSVRKFIKG